MKICHNCGCNLNLGYCVSCQESPRGTVDDLAFWARMLMVAVQAVEKEECDMSHQEKHIEAALAELDRIRHTARSQHCSITTFVPSEHNTPPQISGREGAKE